MNIKKLTYTALFTALIAVGAFLRIPVPYVPITLQFQFTNLAGLLLGKKYGAAAVAAYIIAGLAGAPVFTGGGGPGYVLRPTFGYIAGFLLGAYAAGAIFTKKPSYKTALAASFVNLAIVYAAGMIYFYFISKFYSGSPIGAGALFLHCFALTAPGDAVLSFLSAKLALKLKPFIGPSFDS